MVRRLCAADHLVFGMHTLACQKTGDDNAVEHGRVCLVVLLALDQRSEGLCGVYGDDFIASLELANLAICDKGAGKNLAGNSADDLAPDGARHGGEVRGKRR